ASRTAHAALGQYRSVVLVHGFNGGDGSSGSTPNGSPNGNCDSYWGDAKSFLLSHWGPDVRTVQYYNNEGNCNDNGYTLNIGGYSADLHDPLYANNCTNYH